MWEILKLLKFKYIAKKLSVLIFLKAIFDRNRKDELPALQLEWINGICKPLYEVKTKQNKKYYTIW